jgi:hypothetical protein
LHKKVRPFPPVFCAPRTASKLFPPL